MKSKADFSYLDHAFRGRKQTLNERFHLGRQFESSDTEVRNRIAGCEVAGHNRSPGYPGCLCRPSDRGKNAAQTGIITVTKRTGLHSPARQSLREKGNLIAGALCFYSIRESY